MPQRDRDDLLGWSTPANAGSGLDAAALLVGSTFTATLPATYQTGGSLGIVRASAQPVCMASDTYCC